MLSLVDLINRDMVFSYFFGVSSMLTSNLILGANLSPIADEMASLLTWTMQFWAHVRVTAAWCFAW